MYAPFHTLDERFLKEAGEPESRLRFTLRALQLLPSAFESADYTRNGSRNCKRDLAALGAVELTVCDVISKTDGQPDCESGWPNLACGLVGNQIIAEVCPLCQPLPSSARYSEEIRAVQARVILL